MKFSELENTDIALIAAFDKNGRLRIVIDSETYCDVGAIVVDDALFQKVPPADTFVKGVFGPVNLRKIEPFEIIVYEYPSVSAAGRRRRAIHVQGNLIPHPDD